MSLKEYTARGFELELCGPVSGIFLRSPSSLASAASLPVLLLYEAVMITDTAYGPSLRARYC